MFPSQQLSANEASFLSAGHVRVCPRDDQYPPGSRPDPVISHSASACQLAPGEDGTTKQGQHETFKCTSMINFKAEHRLLTGNVTQVPGI